MSDEREPDMVDDVGSKEGSNPTASLIGTGHAGTPLPPEQGAVTGPAPADKKQPSHAGTPHRREQVPVYGPLEKITHATP